MIEKKKAMPAPFDLERAKKGDEVITRDGHNARIICFDMKGTDYPIIALVEAEDGSETILLYTSRGELIKGETNATDLFMKPKHHIAYINVFKDKSSGVVYSVLNMNATEEKNDAYIRLIEDEYLGTKKFEWEE